MLQILGDSVGPNVSAHQRPRHEPYRHGRLVQRMLGRPPVVAESQFLDVSEFAEIAIERAEGQVTGFPRNLQDQAI